MTFSLTFKKKIAGVLSGALVASTIATPVASADELDEQIRGPLTLADAMYYDAHSDQIRLDEGRIDHDRVTNDEIQRVEAGLEKLTDEQIDAVLADNDLDPDQTRQSDDSGVSFRIAPVIIWGGVAILGILTGGGLIFYAIYTTHEEKKQLIDKCYSNGGTPAIDSKDSSGVEGTTDSGAAKHAGGYRFECQK